MSISTRNRKWYWIDWSYILISKNDKIDYRGIELDKEAFYKSQQLKLNTINGDFREMDKIEEQVRCNNALGGH